MGGKSSKRSAPGRYSSFSSSSNSWSHNEYQQSTYPQPTQTYESARPPQSYGGRAPDTKKGPERKFAKINDNFNSLEQVNFSFLSNYLTWYVLWQQNVCPKYLILMQVLQLCLSSSSVSFLRTPFYIRQYLIISYW